MKKKIKKENWLTALSTEQPKLIVRSSKINDQS